MEANLESVMESGDMVVEAVRATSMSLIPTRAVEIMKVRRNHKEMYREGKYRGKGTETGTALIKVARKTPDSAVVLISEG